jgi:hypothetical protein
MAGGAGGGFSFSALRTESLGTRLGAGAKAQDCSSPLRHD